MEKISAIRGMKDLLPTDTDIWLEVEKICTQSLRLHGFRQIRTPIIEHSGLFARSIGDATDIVSKEMYTFIDRNGDSLSLRPEGTASCVRAGIEHGLFYNQQQRLWYLGNFFRHERPQKGRYRQFTQLGAECYGWHSADIEAELLGLLANLFADLGLKNTRLQINSLGDKNARDAYRQALVQYLEQYADHLDGDSQRQLRSNPLRILDSKNPGMQQLLESAPGIFDFLSDDSKAHFEQLKTYLNALQIAYQVNPKLVRGLDYYNDTVFEWICDDYGAQATVCGGGRYDQMVAQLGGESVPAFGFALGLERLVEILREQQAAIARIDCAPDVYLISTDIESRKQMLVLQSGFTAAGLRTQLFCGTGSMKNQFKRADRSGAKVAAVIGEQEAQQAMVTLKPLRGVGKQQQCPQKDAVEAVTILLESL